MKTAVKKYCIAAIFLIAAVLWGMLLFGCVSDEADRDQPRRRGSRAGEYSRIPANYPSDWQTRSIGN